MTSDPSGDTQYKIADWASIEHCVYHALTDAPENLSTHRVAHLVGRLAAALIEKGVFTGDELESYLRSCRG